MNFLRTGKLLTKDIKHIQDELLEEAEFYQIKGLIDLINYRAYLRGSSIITEKQQLESFNGWFAEEDRKWRLVYSGSKDGWESRDFHQCCDSYSETLIVVKSENDHIFGGYGASPWTCSGKLVSCVSFFTFIFII